MLLCYVGHHDDAYRWAARRKIERHPKTGATQIVEFRETVPEIAVPRHVQAGPQPTVSIPVFEDAPTETLMRCGVPVDWVDDVRQADEDTLLDILVHLPPDASDALLELATGGTPAARSAGAGPLEQAAAEGRFGRMTTVSDLNRALEAPWHFCIKLTSEGGPPPFQELERVARVAEENPVGVTYLATRKTGRSLRIGDDSTCLAFAVAGDGRVRFLRGRIVSRRDQLPPDGLLLDMYEGHGFGVFWQLRDVTLVDLDGLHLVPGVSARSGKTAAEAFTGSLTFAYWRLQDAAARPPEPAPTQHPPAPSAGREPARWGDLPVPTVSLHGVDFSGARERQGRNPKLWIASWEAGSDEVILDWGGDEERGFTRTALAERIARSRGLWVLDFPFGPARDVAAAMGWTRWEGYLEWCAGRPDATELRDEARHRVKAAGGRWSSPAEPGRDIKHRFGHDPCGANITRLPLSLRRLATLDEWEYGGRLPVADRQRVISQRLQLQP